MATSQNLKEKAEKKNSEAEKTDHGLQNKHVHS